MNQSPFPFACRSCGSTEINPVLSLGSTPLANSLLTREQLDQPELRYPLELVRCLRCTLAQITATVSSDSLFREYLYFSSFSDTMLQHARSFAERMIEERELSSRSLVVEIASNDGYLLRNYRNRDIPVLGIEPARNIARIANDQHYIPTVPEFFTSDLANKLVAEGRRADVIHANNVLAHVPDLNGFVAGIKFLLKETGVAVIEAPYLIDLIDHREFDTIYHEHLCYFSMTALDLLFDRNGLTIEHVERLPIHGGSLRLFAVPKTATSKLRPTVESLLAEERQWGVDQLRRYDEFRDRVCEVIEQLRDTLRELKSLGKSIAVYGASAKGSTLLNYAQLPPGTLDFVVDRSTVKQNRFTPGTRLPIYPPSKLIDSRPDYTLLLTWNFAEEIFEQQAGYRALGGKFIIPLPELRIV